MLVPIVAFVVGASATLYETFQYYPAPAIFAGGVLVAFVAGLALCDRLLGTGEA